MNVFNSAVRYGVLSFVFVAGAITQAGPDRMTQPSAAADGARNETNNSHSATALVTQGASARKNNSRIIQEPAGS